MPKQCAVVHNKMGSITLSAVDSLYLGRPISVALNVLHNSDFDTFVHQIINQSLVKIWKKKKIIRLHASRITSFCTHHFIKNIKSPLLSVAPMIRSGSRFLAKPRGFSGYKWRQTHEAMQETGTLTNVFVFFFLLSLRPQWFMAFSRISLTLATFLSKGCLPYVFLHFVKLSSCAASQLLTSMGSK